MGKNKSGLRREKGLRIVRGAGFKIHKRKQLDDVSENRRAGLNTKNKKVEGEKLVKRKQPLALKHKRRIRKAVVALSAVFIAALSLFGYGFLVGGGENFIADGIYDTAYLATDSGLTPDDLSSKTHGYNGTVSGEEDDGWKTIGYLNYTLRNQPWYYSSMAGDIAINTPLGAMTQHVATEKQFYGNVLISSESTTTPVSLMGIKIEEANQFAVISDPKVVIWRKSASSDSSTFKGKDTPWSDGQPQGATWEDFRKMRGNLQNEFSVYVINRDTLLGWSEITKNADGTYSQSFKLNHEQQPPEKSAIYYYQKQMQASGGLPSLPRFSSVEVTYTFDDKWQVLRSEIVENYTAAYGPIDANGFSSSVTEYSYDEEKAKNTFYEDYFKKYETSFGAPAEKELTVTDCLSSAFGDVLTGEAKLAVDLDLGGKSLSGIVHLNLNENDVRVSLGNIKAYVRQGEDSELYIAYGNNTKIKIPLSAITGGAEPSEPAAGIALKAGIKTAEAKTAGAPLNTDDLMSQLMGGEFTVAEDKSSAILSSELDLFGIKVPLTFNFVITDGVVSLGDVETEISVLGTDIGAKLYFTENDIPALTDSEAESYVPLDISSFISLASAEALKVDVAYEDDYISLSGEVVINLSQLAVKADLKLVLNGDGGAEKDVVAIYKEGEIYLTIGSAGETPAKIKADVNGLSELINELLGKDADVEIGKAELLGKVLETVEKTGLGNILEKILLNREFADNFAITTENGFTLTVHGSEILEMSGADFELGDIVISAGSGAVTVSVLGVSGELKACHAFSFDDKEYTDAAELIPVINKLKDIITDGKLSVGGLVSLNLKGAEAELRIDLLSVSWENGIEIDLKGELSFKDYSQKITASYNGERASLSFGEVGITLDNSQFGELEQALADIISAATGGSTELPRLSGMEDLLALLQTEEQPDILAVINALTISGADGGVTLELGNLKVSVFDEPNGASGLFGAEALWQSEDISINIAAHIKEYVAPEAPDYHIDYFDAAEIIPLIENAEKYISESGLTISGNVTIDLKDSGKIQIELTNAAISWKNGIEATAQVSVTYCKLEKEIALHYGQDGIQLYYDGIGVELKQDNQKEFIAAVQDLYNAIAAEANLPELKEATLQGIMEMLGMASVDSNNINIADILNNLELVKSNSGNLCVKYGDITAELINTNGDLSATVGYKDIAATVQVAEYSEVEMPEAEYFNGEKLIPLMENVTAILKNGGVNVSGDITIPVTTGESKTELNINLTNVSVSWKNGIEATAQVSVTYCKLEKEIALHYGQDGIQLYYDGIGVELKQDNQKEFIAAVQGLYNAIAAEANLPELKEATLQGIMEMLGMSSVDSNNINIADILNSLKLTQNNSGNLCVTYGEITAELINTNGDLSVTVNYKDIAATVNVGEYSEVKMPEAEYFNSEKLVPLMENATAILKDKGLNISGNVTIDLKDSGKIQIELTNAAISWKNGIEVTAQVSVTYGDLEKDISVHYGKEGIQLYYDGIGVELKQDNVNEFITAAQTLYAEIAKAVNNGDNKIPELLNAETLNGLISKDENFNIADILNSLELVKSEAGNLCVTYGDITAELINTNGDLSATVGYKDIAATVQVAEYSEVEMPEAEYFNGEKLIPLMEKITTILKDKGLNVSGDITIKTSAGDIGIGISALSIKWDESNAFTFGLSATLTLDKTTHAVYAEYDGKTLSLVYDNIGVSLAQSEYDSFITAAAALYNAIAAEANLPELKEATLQGIMEMLGMSSVDSNNINIADILNSLKLTQNNSGNLCVTYGEITAELINTDGDLSVTVNYKDIAATVQVAEYAGGKSLLPSETEARYFKAQEIIPLMKEATEIISNNGLTIGGTLSATVGSTEMQITVYGLSLNWAEGIELVLDARITVNGTDHDIYAEYSAASGSLTFVYGALDNGAGVQLNVKDDAPTLEAALVKLYNRLAEVINTIVEEKPMKPAEDLNGVYEGLTPIINTISDLIKTLQNASESIKDLTGKIEDVKAEKLNIFTVINSFEYSMNNKKFTIELGGINLSVWKDSLGFNLGVQTDSMGLELNGLTVIKTEPTASFGIEPSDLMTADDLCELTDYIAAAVEMLAKDTFEIDLKGTVTTTDERYKDVEGNVKYNVDARFEYVQGKEYPVHIETGADGGESNLWISPDMYARVTVNLKSTIIDVDSVLFDIYILDGNPEINGDGLTAGELKQDGELDVYMSLSRIPSELNDKDGANHSNPVKVYAPVSEIMTIAAAGVSMADLNNITTDYKEINDIITKVADTLDVLLVDKYLTYTKDQFSSLGASLLEQILGGKVSDIITNLLKTLGGAEESTETAPETAPQPRTDEEREQVEYGKYDRERKGALAKFAVTPTKDESGKTAKTTFEVQVENGATASVTKENYPYNSYTDADGAEQSEEREGTRITNVTVKNSKLNATDVIPELTVNVGYNGIEKPTELAGYTSFVGVENLLQAIVSSATHSEAGENGAYALNNNFYITGTLGVSASLGSWELADHQITIDGLSVSLDEEKNIEVNLKLHYEGLNKVITLVNGASSVDMTIKNGMVYLKRVQTTKYGGLLGNKVEPITPETIYRIMPLDTFMADIMHQIVFIFNFSDTIANAMNSSNPPIELNYKQDYGEQLADYFKSLILTENENGDMSWQVTLHNTGINRLAGMSSLLSDGASVTLHGEREEVKNESGETLFNKYTIKSLDLSAALFNLLKISGNLVWRNPCNVYDEGSEAAKNALESSAPSVKAEEWLDVSGAYTFNDIKANIEWDKLATSINGASAEPVNPEFSTDTESYLEVVFGGDENNYDNITSHARLGKYGYYLNEGGEERLLIEKVVWFTDQNSEICSKNIADPDLSEYSKEHYGIAWGDTVRSGSTFKKIASYVAEKYNVTIHSEHYMPNYDSGDNDYVYEYIHTYGDKVDIDMSYEIRTENAGDKWYRIAYVECNGEKYYRENIDSLVIGADADITVVWEEIPHATVTVESEHEIAGFESAGGKWQKTFEIETGKDVNLKELVGEIADTAEGYTFGGFTLSEGDGETSDIIKIDGATTVYVKWIEPEISVNYYSSLNVADYTQTVKEGYTSVYTISKTYTLGGGFGVETPATEGYIFLGWFYNDGETWIKVTDVKNDIKGSDKYSVPVDLHALWYTYEMEDFTVKHTASGGWLSKTHSYDFDPVTVNAALYGNIGLLKELSFSDVNIYTIAKNNADYQTNTSHPWTGDAGKGKFEQNSNLIEEENRLEMTATFDADSYVPGGKDGKTHVVAVAEFEVMLGENVITEHRQGNNEIKKEGTING